jgi:hypothetical protein
MILENQWQTTKVIYPFLNSAFSQCVAVTQIVDFNVLDVVAVLLVGFACNRLARGCGGRLDDWRSGHLGVLAICSSRGQPADVQSEWAAHRHAGCPSSPGSAR